MPGVKKSVRGSADGIFDVFLERFLAIANFVAKVVSIMSTISGPCLGRFVNDFPTGTPRYECDFKAIPHWPFGKWSFYVQRAEVKSLTREDVGK